MCVSCASYSPGPQFLPKWHGNPRVAWCYSAKVIRRHPIPEPLTSMSPWEVWRGPSVSFWKCSNLLGRNNLCYGSFWWGLSPEPWVKVGSGVCCQRLEQMGSCHYCCQELSLIYGVPTTTSIPSLWTPQKAPGALAMLLKSQEMKYIPQFPLVCKYKLNVMQGHIHRFGRLINCVFRK